MEQKKIKSRKEAIEAFTGEYGSLARALNPAAPAYDGYDFIKYTIRVKEGKPFAAYIASDTAKTTTFIVPIDGSTPSIEDYKNVRAIKKVRTVEDAKAAFINEYGSLARALNPAAQAYDGFEFQKHTICFRNNRFKAFIASDTAKTTYFIVPTNGDLPDIVDYNEVKIVR